MFKPFTPQQDEVFDYSMKIVLVGDSGTGKTTLIQQYTKRLQQFIQPTIGVDFSVIYLQTTQDNVKLKCTVFDTAGQERFRSLATTFFKDADGILLVYDLTRRDSFANIPSWLTEIHKHAKNPTLTLELVANKLDLAADQRQVTMEQLKDMVDDCEAECSHEVGHVLSAEVSAMANLNLNETLEKLIWEILQRKRNPQHLQEQIQKYAITKHATQTTTTPNSSSNTTSLPPSSRYAKSKNNEQNCAGFQSKSINGYE